jgi:hypothetical protein
MECIGGGRGSRGGGCSSSRCQPASSVPIIQQASPLVCFLFQQARTLLFTFADRRRNHNWSGEL